MSPYETLQQPRSGRTADSLSLLLQQYAVTSNGFLPDKAPLDRLPDPYYAPWESLVESLPESLKQGVHRDQVVELPVLSTEYLTTEAEWRRAYVILGFLTHAWIWGGDRAAEILPPSITIPFLSVSQHLGIPPVATYASLNLWNFRTSNPSLDLTDLDSLHAQLTFTGTEDESWFYMVSVAMEAQGAYIIPVMLQALEAVAHRDYPTMTRALGELTRCIHKLGLLLDRMDERCSPSVFYHRIRPFLAGSKNMAAAGLPRGVWYSESSGGRGGGRWRQLRGGSNGQSSLIQFLDMALGVEHTAHGNGSPFKPKAPARGGTTTTGADGKEPGEVSFHQEVREYMPEPHRLFLQHVTESYPGGMRRAVAELLAGGGEEEEGVLSEEQLALRAAFQAATKALAEFRNKHLQIVTRYIIIPSRQPNPERSVNLATASSRIKFSSGAEGTEGGELTGTGGTALLPFLKQSRDETFQAGELR